MTETGKLSIEYLPLSDLLRWRHPRNPKDHVLEELDDSMERFGYTMPVAIDEETGNLAAGHGRVDTLEARRQEGKEPPSRIEVDEGGEWLVPTIRGLRFDDPDELVSYLIADNLLTEAGGWVGEILAEDVRDLIERLGEEEATRGIGMTDEKLDAILTWHDEPDEFPEEEYDEEPPATPESERGAVYELGRHRLMCGDATDPEDVRTLMDGARAGAIVTDPPYGINREGIANDDPETLRRLYDQTLSLIPADDAVVACFQSPKMVAVWLDAIRDAGHDFERLLWLHRQQAKTFPWRGWVLASDAIALSTVGDPRWPEPEGHCHDTYTKTELEDPALTGEHTTIKPAWVFADLIEKLPGPVVYDPFVGSGTAIAAAETTGRTCYAMEIEPGYCDVVRRRYARLVDDESYAP